MRESRRKFTWRFAAAAVCVSGSNGLLLAQNPPTPPPAPAPGGQLPEAAPNAAEAQATRRALLKRRETEFRAGVERLYNLTSELRDDVQKTLTADVLSMRMVKKMEQIEKLAKELKNKAKGG
jgi:hypothetical protein